MFKNRINYYYFDMKKFIDSDSSFNLIPGPRKVIYHNKAAYFRLGYRYVDHRFDLWTLDKIAKAIGLTFVSLLLLPLFSYSFRKLLSKHWRKGVFRLEKQSFFQKILLKPPPYLRSDPKEDLFSQHGELDKTLASIFSALDQDKISDPNFDALFAQFENLKQEMKSKFRVKQLFKDRFVKLCKISNFIKLNFIELQKFFVLYDYLAKNFLGKEQELKEINLTSEQIFACLKEKSPIEKFQPSSLERFAIQFNQMKMLLTYHIQTHNLSNSGSKEEILSLFKKLTSVAEGAEEEADPLEFFFIPPNDVRVSFLNLRSEKLANKLLEIAFRKNSLYKHDYLLEICKDRKKWLLSNSDQTLASYIQDLSAKKLAPLIQLLTQNKRLATVIACLKNEMILPFLPLLKPDFSILAKLRSEETLYQDFTNLLNTTKTEDSKLISNFLNLFKNKKKLYLFLQTRNSNQLSLCFCYLDKVDQLKLLNLLFSDLAAAAKSVSGLLLSLIPSLNQDCDFWETQFQKKLLPMHLIWKTLQSQTQFNLDSISLEFIIRFTRSCPSVLFEKENHQTLASFMQSLVAEIPLKNLKNSLTNLFQLSRNPTSIDLLKILPALQECIETRSHVSQ